MVTLGYVFIVVSEHVEALGERQDHDTPRDLNDINNVHSVVDQERRDIPLPSLIERQSSSNSNDTNNDQRRIFEQSWVRQQ